MTDLNALLAELRAKAEAATGGEWRDGWYGDATGTTPLTTPELMDVFYAMVKRGGPFFFEVAPARQPEGDTVAIALVGNGPTSEANAAYIAAANPAVVLRLLSALEDATRAVEAVRKVRKEHRRRKPHTFSAVCVSEQMHAIDAAIAAASPETATEGTNGG